GAAQPVVGRIGRIGVTDAGVGLDDVGQAGVGDVLAERGSVAGVTREGGAGGIALDQWSGSPVEFAGQSAFSDPGLPEERDQLGGTVAYRPLQSVDEEIELVLTLHQRNVVRLGAGSLLDLRQRQPYLGGGGTTPQGHRWLGGVPDGLDGERASVVADQDTAGWGDRLQAGGGVDDIARDDGLSAVAGGGYVDQRLAGGDADPKPRSIVLIGKERRFGQ